MNRLFVVALILLAAAVSAAREQDGASRLQKHDQVLVEVIYAIPPGDILSSHAISQLPATTYGQQRRDDTHQLRGAHANRLPVACTRDARTTNLPSSASHFMRAALCSWTTATPPPFLHV